MKKITKKEKGFTIIEVLIVLAIAALILLIVFLAVPALQRNSRNNARNGDMARFGAAVNEFVSNNNGVLPTEAQTVTIITNMGNMGGYEAALAPAGDRNVTVSNAQAAIGTTPNRTFFRLVTSASCGAGGATIDNTDRRGAVQHQLETNGGGVTNICREI